MSNASKVQLLNAATHLFANQGYAGTSVQEIAKRAGVNISLVSYHFGGKLGLYRACLEQLGDSTLASTESCLSSCKNEAEFRVRLEIFVEDFLQVHMNNREIVKMIFRAENTETAEIEGVFRQTFIKNANLIIDFLSHAKKRGWLAPDVDPQAVAATLLGTMAHLVQIDHLSERYFGKTLQDPKERRNFRDKVLRIVLDGAANTPQKKSRKTPPNRKESKT
jgi:AcrR family transcriptional regulator